MKKRIISLAAAVSLAISVLPSAFAAEINEELDEVLFYDDCEAERDGLTLSDGAPDGSNFYTTSSDISETDLGAVSETSDHCLYEADVRFDEVGSGFTIRNRASGAAGGNWDTYVCRYDENDGTPKLAVQTGSGATAYSRYMDIDPEMWYHIQLIGSYGKSTDPILMQVYEWHEGVMEFVNDFDNVTKRNNKAATRIVFAKSTSFDNPRITRLGADELTITSIPENTTAVNAGGSLTFVYSANRDGRAVDNPAAEWKVFEDGEEVTDGSVTINDSGELSVSRKCSDKEVTVKVISTEPGAVEGEYPLTIHAVNFDDLKYDSITLAADRSYVTADEPLALNVTASKDGAEVELAEGDVYFYIYDENNLQEIGNRYIRVEDGTLYVDKSVLSQNISVHAGDYLEAVYAELPVRIKASDATEIGEEGEKEQILFVDAGENTGNKFITSGSWDGSHYYNYTESAVAAAVEKTSEDVIIQFDIKFVSEAEININTGGKVGGQFARSGSNLVKYNGSKPTAICAGDAESWYHVDYMVRTGGSESNYATVYIYKYDDEGNLVHPTTGAANKPLESSLGLRTVSSSNLEFNVLNVNAGIAMDNLRILKMQSDEIAIKTTTNAIFAGQSVQASYTVSRQGSQLTYFPAGKIEWELLDADDTVSIDENGLVTTSTTTQEQTVYIKVTATDSGVYATVPLTIKSSDVFKVTGIGISEDGTKVTELKVEKNFFYNGDAVFVVTAFDEDGRCAGVATRTVHNNTYAIGESKINVNMSLPLDEEGNPKISNVSAFVWTGLYD